MKKLQSILAGMTLIVGLGLAPNLVPGPALAVDNIESTDAPDLTSVLAKIKAKDYAGALAELRDLAEDTQQADVYNLLGFTLRKTGDFKTSLTYYTKALELKPDHKAAREYLGELYVETGDMEKAKEQLSVLAKLCPGGCEEREDLRVVGNGAFDLFELTLNPRTDKSADWSPKSLIPSIREGPFSRYLLRRMSLVLFPPGRRGADSVAL
jgi:Tetratricopeptide repeat